MRELHTFEQIQVREILIPDQTHVLKDFTMTQPAKAYQKGLLLKHDKNTNKVSPITAVTEEIFGILATDITQENADTVVSVYVKGSFNIKELYYGDNTKTDIEKFVHDATKIGIILR